MLRHRTHTRRVLYFLTSWRETDRETKWVRRLKLKGDCKRGTAANAITHMHRWGCRSRGSLLCYARLRAVRGQSLCRVLDGSLPFIVSRQRSVVGWSQISYLFALCSCPLCRGCTQMPLRSGHYPFRVEHPGKRKEKRENMSEECSVLITPLTKFLINFFCFFDWADGDSKGTHPPPPPPHGWSIF